MDNVSKKGFALLEILGDVYEGIVKFMKNIGGFGSSSVGISKRGFTLIELLVVIAILALLSVAVILVLNPAELIKQSRDSTRISDMAAINTALAIYLSDVRSGADLDTSNPASFDCGDRSCTAAGNPPSGSCVTIATTTVDGTGWIPVDFTAISSGPPFSRLPIDPVNSTTFFYIYGCNNSTLTYEVMTKMESTRYATTSATEIVSNAKDGGDDSAWYEIGNEPGLDLL